jgi:hypothetical protein
MDGATRRALLLHPWPSWHKLSWFAEFLAAMPDYERNTIATARMAIAAREHLFAWAQAENIARSPPRRHPARLPRAGGL